MNDFSWERQKQTNLDLLFKCFGAQAPLILWHILCEGYREILRTSSTAEYGRFSKVSVLYMGPLFQIFTQSIDAIDVTSVTLSCLNSINAIDVTRC